MNKLCELQLIDYWTDSLIVLYLTRFAYDPMKTVVFTKPLVLDSWLTIAKERGYTHVRVVLHGTSPAGFAGVANDSHGFNLEFGGTRLG